jgi:hypothetical protein
MSVYARIFAATSKRLASAGQSGKTISPLTAWAFPGFVFGTWMIWGALSDDIKMSIGLYYDPDVVINRVQAEKDQRMAARAKSTDSSGKAEPAEEPEEEEEEAEEEEEQVTHEDIVAAVEDAVEQSGGGDDEEEEEEEEEAPKLKAPRKKVEDMTNEEMWEYFAEKTIVGSDVSCQTMIFVQVDLRQYCSYMSVRTTLFHFLISPLCDPRLCRMRRRMTRTMMMMMTTRTSKENTRISNARSRHNVFDIVDNVNSFFLH